MNMHTYGGANLIPKAMPDICNQKIIFKHNLRFFLDIFSENHIVLAFIALFIKTFKPPSCGILG